MNENEKALEGAQTDVAPRRAPKTFLQTVQDHNYGHTADELTAALQECIREAERTGKATKLTFDMEIKPAGKNIGRYTIPVEIKTKLPKKEREAAIMFVGPNGDLTNKDPRQMEIEGIRMVENRAAVRLQEEAPQAAIRVA